MLTGRRIVSEPESFLEGRWASFAPGVVGSIHTQEEKITSLTSSDPELIVFLTQRIDAIEDALGLKKIQKEINLSFPVHTQP